MHLILTPAELQIVLRLLEVEQLPGIVDCYRGWFAEEKDQSVLQSVITLSYAGYVHQVDADLHLSTDIREFMAPIQNLHDAFVIERRGNKLRSSFKAFYTDRVSPAGVVIEQYGLNSYRLLRAELQECSEQLVQFGVRDYSSTVTQSESFQLAQAHVARLFEVNPQAQNETVKLTARHWHLGVEYTQILAYVRASWWQVENLGNECTFIPVELDTVQELLRTFSTRVSV